MHYKELGRIYGNNTVSIVLKGFDLSENVTN